VANASGYLSEVRIGVLVRAPSRPSPYAIWTRVPADLKLMPHRDQPDRVYTGISALRYIGLGDAFDEAKLTPQRTRKCRGPAK
jgi:hypothetical protein